MKSMVDYALFSQTVTKVMNEIITTLVDKYNLRGRYQSPVFGGDDLLLLLPANEVINIAKELLEKIPSRFSAEADKIGGDVAEQLKDISLSLGFVIVPAHFAIRFAVDYAEEALRSGKKGRRERIKEGNRGKEADCLDYLVIKDASPLNLSMEKLREKHLVSRGGIKLTTKPISVSRFSKMLDDLKYLRQSGVSLSQLQQIESLLWTESHKTISLNLRYQWLKTESWQRFFEQRSSNRDLIKGIEDWLSHDMLKKTLAGRESYFLDLMELYEFGSKEYD